MPISVVYPLKTHPLPSVDSQILYKQYRPLDGEEVAAVIVAVAEKVGVPRSACQLLNTSDDLDKRFLCGKFHILVTQSAPFEHNLHIDASLETFYAQSTFPEAAALMDEVAACTQVSVKKSLLPTDALPDNLEAFSGAETLAFCDVEETLQAMEIARLITAVIVERSQPDAVLWVPSSFLLKPDAFSALARASNFDDLYLLPNPYWQQDRETGEQLIGIVGMGTQWLTGYQVEVLPCRLPPNYLAEVIVGFSKLTRKNDRLTADGDLFGRDENEKIQVIYHDQGDDRLSKIELKVVHNPQYGIIREDEPTVYVRKDNGGAETSQHDDSDANLDPHDPVDAAILERLQKLNEKNLLPETDEAWDMKELEQEASAQQLPEMPEPRELPELADTSTKQVYTEQPQTAPIPVDPPVEKVYAVPSSRSTETGGSRPVLPSSKRMSVAELRDFVKQVQVSTDPAEGAGKKGGFLAKLFKRKAGK